MPALQAQFEPAASFGDEAEDLRCARICIAELIAAHHWPAAAAALSGSNIHIEMNHEY
jgi:hypothetical protein